MKVLIHLLTVIIFFTLVYSQDKDEGTVYQTEVVGIGTSAAAFLEIGAGARAMAMGGAYVAVANDATALYWNPAGIVWANRTQLEIMHNEWLVETSYDFAGVVIPLPSFNSAIGISYITLGVDEQPVRTVERPEGTGEYYDARDFAVALTYAIALTDRFSFGLSGKYINQRIWHESGGAFAADIGIFYNTELEGLRLGFCMSNFGSEIQLSGIDLETSVDPDEKVENFDKVPSSYNTDAYPLPLLFRVGISYEKDLDRFGSALLTVDLNHPSNSPEYVNVGFEYGFANMFFIRGGYENLFEDDTENGLTLGAGIDYYNNSSNFGIRFDYAWSDWGILDNAQRFSIGLIF
ncbi:MAG: PorV/PorQ family protein [Ignavibacteria bacterium]|jgi:opacity protein-like surface antigen